ncbi:MAG: MFS transporter [Eubacteriales bacterium]|nr:MFS transporter [Eubacteriales bacterium]
MNKYNFGKKGWMIVILCFFMYVLTCACTTDGENIILPKLAAANGWEYTMVLNLASVAGCCSVIGNLFLGKLCDKKGPKFSIILGLLASAVFVFLYATATSIAVYVVGLFGAICFAQSFAFFGANSLIANWFPRKKGLAMGFVSIGPPIATISMISVMNFLMNNLGLKKGVLVICVVLIIVAVVCFLLVKDTPEECGCLPDNMPMDKAETNGQEEAADAKISFTTLIKMKSFWYILIMMGIANLCSTGLMSQFLRRCTDSNISDSKAALMMSAMAIVGIFGSMIVGYVENRFGTRKAFTFFGIWWALAFVLNFTNIPALMYISIPMFGCVITFMQIFIPTFEISAFGRTNFRSANAILFPMISMIGQLTFVLISVCISVFGEVRYAYLFFAALLVVAVLISRGLKLENE